MGRSIHIRLMCLDVHRKQFCVEALKRNIFSEFSVYIRKVLSVEHVDFIHVFLLYLQKRNDGQNLVPKMGIYLHIRYLRIYAHARS